MFVSDWLPNSFLHEFIKAILTIVVATILYANNSRFLVATALYGIIDFDKGDLLLGTPVVCVCFVRKIMSAA